ncbi:hypothetical protein BJY01DRAFT_248848 [Aspergillus pseudoustus]|uniref:Uncharacterized protein n=1 Tax=Aspergillus pseudoustus TaxID=1810923 RepID=A0ABR4JVC7_9EURO
MNEQPGTDATDHPDEGRPAQGEEEGREGQGGGGKEGTGGKQTGKGGGKPPQPIAGDVPPIGPWGDRGVTSRNAGTNKAPANPSSLNVRINLDLRADVALELHAVIQGDITIGLF